MVDSPSTRWSFLKASTSQANDITQECADVPITGTP